MLGARKNIIGDAFKGSHLILCGNAEIFEQCYNFEIRIWLTFRSFGKWRGVGCILITQGEEDIQGGALHPCGCGWLRRGVPHQPQRQRHPPQPPQRYRKEEGIQLFTSPALPPPPPPPPLSIRLARCVLGWPLLSFSCGLRYTATTTIHKCTKVLQRKGKGKINIVRRPALTVADWTFSVLPKDFHKFFPLLLPHDGCSVRPSFVLRRSGKLMCVWDDDRPPSISPSPHVLSRKVPIAGSMKKKVFGGSVTSAAFYNIHRLWVSSKILTTSAGKRI